jgi:hypothetical protein
VRLEQVPVRLLAHRQVLVAQPLEGPAALPVVVPERSSDASGADGDHREAALFVLWLKVLRRMSERRSQNYLAATSFFERLGWA